MEYTIEPIKNAFYVFSYDELGNKYDTMHHFKNKKDAETFIAKLKKGDARYCVECEQWEEK